MRKQISALVALVLAVTAALVGMSAFAGPASATGDGDGEVYCGPEISHKEYQFRKYVEPTFKQEKRSATKVYTPGTDAKQEVSHQEYTYKKKVETPTKEFRGKYQKYVAGKVQKWKGFPHYEWQDNGTFGYEPYGPGGVWGGSGTYSFSDWGPNAPAATNGSGGHSDTSDEYSNGGNTYRKVSQSYEYRLLNTEERAGAPVVTWEYKDWTSEVLGAPWIKTGEKKVVDNAAVAATNGSWGNWSPMLDLLGWTGDEPATPGVLSGSQMHPSSPLTWNQSRTVVDVAGHWLYLTDTDTPSKNEADAVWFEQSSFEGWTQFNKRKVVDEEKNNCPVEVPALADKTPANCESGETLTVSPTAHVDTSVFNGSDHVAITEPTTFDEPGEYVVKYVPHDYYFLVPPGFTQPFTLSGPLDLDDETCRQLVTFDQPTSSDACDVEPSWDEFPAVENAVFSVNEAGDAVLTADPGFFLGFGEEQEQIKVLTWELPADDELVCVGTIAAPTVVGSDCEVDGDIVLPEVEGIEWEVEEGDTTGEEPEVASRTVPGAGIYTVTASALEGYVITEGVQTVWVIDVPAADPQACPPNGSETSDSSSECVDGDLVTTETTSTETPVFNEESGEWETVSAGTSSETVKQDAKKCADEPKEPEVPTSVDAGLGGESGGTGYNGLAGGAILALIGAGLLAASRKRENA